MNRGKQCVLTVPCDSRVGSDRTGGEPGLVFSSDSLLNDVRLLASHFPLCDSVPRRVGVADPRTPTRVSASGEESSRRVSGGSIRHLVMSHAASRRPGTSVCSGAQRWCQQGHASCLFILARQHSFF